ncbi:MAG: homogentisate 1,2-dioxygenase [Candidatus Eremiobacteraeota bacterium]|nr:homogentisate 1,2-dioxygenase [Candidatus Eremiobacteraeota bacterium]MBV9057048.1 homogentisate 1,2-dioxygenase [Candidatus Eremiobacteraeota bacterium]
MPSYVRAGELPPKRHIQFRRPDGGLYAEELFSTKGFESVYSLLYHLRPPTATLDVRPWKRPPAKLSVNEPLRNRHLKTQSLELKGDDPIESLTPLLGNDDVLISVAQATAPMEYFYRNTGGDELIFVHHGTGAIETQFGELAYRERDYLVIPTGTIYRVAPASPTRMLVYQSNGAVTIPRKYRNEFGQLEEHAPYYERDFRSPVLKPPVELQSEYEVRVTNGGRNAVYIVQNHPFDVVGWDGYCYPYAFNLDEFAPITGKLHQPPPAHATFEAPGAAFCAFVPRLFDYHPLAIPVPYNHSSVDCDEVLYYVSGNFMSRRGVEEGSITLHAAGAPHGPQPGAVEQSLGKKSTDEIAVMIDTFKPLQLADPALRCEDAEYFRSWVEAATI